MLQEAGAAQGTPSGRTHPRSDRARSHSDHAAAASRSRGQTEHPGCWGRNGSGRGGAVRRVVDLQAGRGPVQSCPSRWVLTGTTTCCDDVQALACAPSLAVARVAAETSMRISQQLRHYRGMCSSAKARQIQYGQTAAAAAQPSGTHQSSCARRRPRGAAGGRHHTGVAPGPQRWDTPAAPRFPPAILCVAVATRVSDCGPRAATTALVAQGGCILTTCEPAADGLACSWKALGPRVGAKRARAT